MADPDLELGVGGGGAVGLDLLALSAIFPSVISSFFTQNKGGGGARAPRAPPLDPPLHKANEEGYKSCDKKKNSKHLRTLKECRKRSPPSLRSCFLHFPHVHVLLGLVHTLT